MYGFDPDPSACKGVFPARAVPDRKYSRIRGSHVLIHADAVRAIQAGFPRQFDVGLGTDPDQNQI